MINNIENIKWPHALVAISSFFGLVAPGFLITFMFFREFFVSLETIKLIIFGLSLSGPVFIINFCSALTIASSIEEDRGPASAMLGLLASSGVLYISILIAYVFDLDFFNFVCVVSGLQIVVIFIVIFVEYLERNKE